MQTLIVGMGEIGSSLYKILKTKYPTYGVDVRKELSTVDKKHIPEKIDVLHICIRYSDEFEKITKSYCQKYKPDLLNICTTVPVGTTRLVDPNGCHSTTRGLHPNLEEGLKTITKHIGGPNAVRLKKYFEDAGIPCRAHPIARTTELLHIMNNVHYGVNLMFADEVAKLCRLYGVDYYDWMLYCESNNDGFMRLGQKTKVRPILTPTNGKIGGHCVVSSANLIPEEKRPDLVDRLAKYNDRGK